MMTSGFLASFRAFKAVEMTDGGGIDTGEGSGTLDAHLKSPLLFPLVIAYVIVSGSQEERTKLPGISI